MPKLFKWLLLLFEILLAAMLVSACPSQLCKSTPPPYALSSPVYRPAQAQDACLVGGIFFDFYNKSEKEVVFIQASMNVFNKNTGELAFAGAAGLSAGSECSIQYCQTKSLCIPLDDYIWQLGDSSSFCVDNFFIRRIEYADGSVWQDNLGVYAYSYREES